MQAIIDFHVHAGKFELLRDDIQDLLRRRPVEPDIDVTRVFSEPRLMEAYLKRNDVVKAVVLAECGPGTNFSIDSRMIAEFVGSNPFFVPFGSINPNVHESVAEWERSERLGVQGFKFYPADHGFDALREDMMEVYKRCERASMPVIFHTGLTAQRDASQQFIRPTEFVPIFEACPELIVILAHAGKPHWYDEAFEVVRSFANVHVDTALVDPQALLPYVEDDVASRKVIFGSDWPVCGSYSAVRTRYEQAGYVNADLLRRILHDNGAELLQRLPARTACTPYSPVDASDLSAHVHMNQ